MSKQGNFLTAALCLSMVFSATTFYFAMKTVELIKLDRNRWIERSKVAETRALKAEAQAASAAELASNIRDKWVEGLDACHEINVRSNQRFVALVESAQKMVERLLLEKEVRDEK